MELEIETKPATASNETEGAIPPSNASHSSPGNDRRSPERNSPEKRRREEEEKRPSLEESDSIRESLHPMWKTSLCSFFRRFPGGICRHGGACRYAHGETELRSRPDNSWDPTSDRAKKMLKTSAGDAAAGDADEEDDAGVNLTCLDKCLIGLPKKWASDNFKSFLDGQGISYKTAKTKKGMTVGFVSFENAEQIKSAIEVLKENTTNGKHIKVADANRRSQEKKQTMEITIKNSSSEDGLLLSSSNLTEDSSAFGTSSVIGTGTKVKTVRDVVTPLAHMSYSDQLEHKKNSLLQTLKRLTRNARKACPDATPLPDWILKSREIGGLPCKLEGILESPLVDGYRNKCEFSVGCSLEGKRTVGFMLGNFREGITAVEEPASCLNVSRISCKYALIFQDFLQSSEFPVWNRIENTGFWRQFTVREGRSPGQVTLNGSLGIEIAEVMLIVQVCSLGYEEEHMRCEFNRMTQALAHGAAACLPPVPLTAIVVQDHRGISNAAPADCPLILLELPKVDGLGGSGVTVTAEARIHDYISNLRFSISPTAFFQVNTLAAERLYSLAGDWAELSPDTLLFDICCGTGTIGLTLAHRVGMVVGIEMNESAVSDATRNAEINAIKNCRFICGKAEDVMGAILKEYLDVPGNHGEVSDDLRSNGVYIVGNGTDKTIIAEDLHDDTGAATDVSPRTGKEMLPCSEDRTMDKLADHTERNIVDGNSEQLIGDSDDLAGFPGTHMAECTGTSDENGECGDTTSNGKYISHTSKTSFEFGNQGQENILLKQSTATNAAAVLQFKKVVAIVDPPRVGLHPIVIKALRTHPRIRQLVYISCNPETLVANAIELCTPTADKQEKAKGNRGWRNMSNAGLARHRVKSMPVSDPFNPVRAMAVDLFPHTPHCEMVMLLER